MPTLDDIRSRLTRIVQDTSYTSEILDGYINEAYTRVASLVLLPDLESTGLITTSTTAASVPIPASWNFDRNLYMCSPVDEDDEESKIEVLSSIAVLARRFPDYRLDVTTGPVTVCTTTRNSFHYYAVPDVATQFNCAFYQKPALLVSDDDTPDSLPEFLHYKLLVSGAAAEIFTEIEEGVDGVMVNTNKHNKRFDNAIDELAAYFRTGQSRPEPSRQSSWI